MVVHQVKKRTILVLRHLRKARQSLNKLSHVLLINSSSVFTSENLSNIPQLDYYVHPSIENLEFTTYGIQLLLERLEPTNAPGPDQIPVDQSN